MAREPRTNDVAPRPRRSKTVWPWVFGVMVLIALLTLLGWGFGWWEAESAGNLPAD
jgi:hypothetical protein